MIKFLKNIIIGVFIAFISASAFSQTNDKDIFKNLLVSVNINQLTSNGSGIDNKMGYGASINWFWLKDRKINIVSGFLFNQTRYYKGFELDESNSADYYSNMTFSLSSLSIPALMRVNFGNTYKFFVETGPSLDLIFALRGNGMEVSEDPNGIKSEQGVSPVFNCKSAGLSYNLGIGMKFPFKKLNMEICASYHYDLSDILREFPFIAGNLFQGDFSGVSLNLSNANKTSLNTIYNYFTIKLGIYI